MVELWPQTLVNVFAIASTKGNPAKYVSHINQLSFSYFEFKIRLFGLGFSFQLQKFLYSNSQPPTDCQSGVVPITPHNQL